MGINIQIPAFISAIIFLIVAVFQLLLFLGIPLGEFSWGGKHKGVLPPRLRGASLLSVIILLFMACVLLVQTRLLSTNLHSIPTHLVVWIITILMGVNTLGNLASKSKQEKLVMTPLTGVAFLSCLYVSIFTV